MRVLVTAPMPEEVLSMIRREHQVEVNGGVIPMEKRELLEKIGGREGLFCTVADKIDEELLEKAGGLKIVASYGVGFDHIDIRAATRRNIMVTNTPGVVADATADLAFTLILAVARRIVEADAIVRGGKFNRSVSYNFMGHDVFGRTLGIIGLGRIGKAVAARASGFGMKILYHSRTRLARWEEEKMGVTFADFETLLREADFVSLHVPLTPRTRHLIGERELQLMKPSAYLVNTTRGPVVDEKALVGALQSRKIRGAGLDVYEDEPELAPGLSKLENVILLPHIGSSTVETHVRTATMAAENLLAGLRGEIPPNCLNPPPA